MPPPDALRALDAARWRIAIMLTVAMMVLYFGFILLVAYNKPLLTRLVVPGLSLGRGLRGVAALARAGGGRRLRQSRGAHPRGR